VLHFCGHGRITSTEEVVVLAGEGGQPDLFGRTRMNNLKRRRQILGKLMPYGPMVVLNSCYSGRTRLFGGEREDLASTFRDEGAEAVIACPAPVCDPMGLDFGQLLYRRSGPDVSYCPAVSGDTFRVAGAISDSGPGVAAVDRVPVSRESVRHFALKAGSRLGSARVRLTTA
jgi:hypothetical protein